MKAPDKIYVLPEVASTVKVLDEELEYIRKDAVLDILENSKHLADAASKIDEI